MSSSQPIRPKNFKERVFLKRLRVQIDGNALVEHGITQVKGIGRRFAQAVIKTAKISPKKRIGILSEKEFKLIEDIILDPVKHGIPVWMCNRKKDLRTGEDRHIFGNELEITTKRDIDRMKRIKSYKGIRHQLGLKVRGQRTKSTGRHGLVIGVIRKKLKKQKKKKE